MAIDSILKSTLTVLSIEVFWIIFVAMLILTPFYVIYIALKVEHGEPDWPQVVIAPIAFFFWVFALGGPFIYLPWYQPVLGAIVLLLATLIIPVLDTLITVFIL